MKMNIYNRSIHEHSRCLLMSASSLFILIILLLIQRLKIQSDSSIKKVVSRLPKFSVKLQTITVMIPLLKWIKTIPKFYILTVLILQNLLHGFFLQQSSFLFLYLFSILVHCSKTRVNMV